MALLTAKEVATLLRVSMKTVRRQTKAGDWKTIKVGRLIRYPLEQFSDFVDTDKVEARIREEADKVDAER